MTSSAESAAPARASQRRVPDFFIVGHHKCGTTALYEMLRRHPQIYMPELKEPRFFASDLRALLGAAPGGLPQTYEEYLALFDPAEPQQRVGEASPSYLRSRVAAGAIAEVAPAARSIAILREPASFVRSLHLQLMQGHAETERDFAKAIANEQITRAGQRVLRYSDHVRYVEQLRRFHAVFPREQVLVLIYDDFRADNEGTVRRAFRFLGVDDAVPIEAIDANPTVSVRSLRLDEALRAMYGGGGPVARGLRSTARALTPTRARRGAMRVLRRRVVYGKPRSPDEGVILQLRRRYKPEVVALSEYLDRDLVTLWGYDRVD